MAASRSAPPVAVPRHAAGETIPALCLAEADVGPASLHPEGETLDARRSGPAVVQLGAGELDALERDQRDRDLADYRAGLETGEAAHRRTSFFHRAGLDPRSFKVSLRWIW